MSTDRRFPLAAAAVAGEARARGAANRTRRSRRAAAYLDGLCDDPGPVVHLTLPANRHVRSRIEGVRLHYAHRLDRTRHPSRVPPRTRVEETVLDLVDDTARPHDVESWVTSACQRGRTTPERIAAALGLRKKIRWRPMLDSMLGDVAAGAQSPLELRHLRTVERAHALPRGHRQRRLAGALRCSGTAAGRAHREPAAPTAVRP